MPTLTLPTLNLPGILRAVLGTRRTPTTKPSRPGPVRVPAPRRPADRPADRPAATTLRLPAPADPDPAPSAGPQAQGDVIVLPWLDFMSPHLRHLHTASAAPVPRTGLTLLTSHVLLAETGRVFWTPWPDSGPTLGTLVVPDGVVARLAHDEHADLRISPGVYAVRRQRRYTPTRTEWVED